jgi:diguanylate cyclase (GGDEF)-like protein
MAVTDELTGTANRREFQMQFRMAVSRYRRYRIPMSIIMIDIDNFKNINDSYGHLTGDKILKQLSRVIQKDSRPDDLPARWGGDEFVILLSCDLHDARITAERLRHAIKETGSSSEHDSNLKITISAGVSEYRDGDSLDSLLARADKALYSAKNGGRDTVHTDS